MMISRERRAFTLVELLVVILIILAVSAVALPTVLSAYSHRQVSESARILQAGLVSARDIAINTNAPAGIRLLPDPTLITPSSNSGVGIIGQIDPTKVLAANRFIPIQLAPDYSEGLVIPFPATAAVPAPQWNPPTTTFAYNVSPAGQVYPANTAAMLYLIEAQFSTAGTYNQPTSWYWNIRIGDKVQIGGAGIYYTVVGPMSTPNAELFVNVGPPGTTPPLLWTMLQGGQQATPEFLFLVNGQDDNHDGFIDNGWDGVDNDGDGNTDQVLVNGLSEWIETEAWPSTISTLKQQSYSITRRPSPAPGSRETALPSNVAIDLTTWNPQVFNRQLRVNTFVSERSRLPVDPITGFVDILLYPNGQVLPTTLYSNPSSFGMGSTFYHFWLAERADLYDPLPQAGIPYLLPMVANATYPHAGDTRGAQALTGERQLLTLNTRTGQILINSIEVFDGTNPSLPFLGAEQGTTGDLR